MTEQQQIQELIEIVKKLSVVTAILVSIAAVYIPFLLALCKVAGKPTPKPNRLLEYEDIGAKGDKHAGL
jgi:hypothetical protein